MEKVGSRTLSNETLVRGARLLREQTMSIEKDEEYAKLLEEKERLLVPQLQRQLEVRAVATRKSPVENHYY